MSQPPYTTIPLHPLCTAFTVSTGLTFLHQRQCPHHHIPLFHCILHTASTSLTFLHQRQCPHHHILLFCCILHPLRTASTSLTFLYQRQCPHHHITLFHCILHPLVWPFCINDNVPTTIYHYSTAYCIHCIHCVLCPLCACIHWFDLFAPKTMSPPPYTTIPLHPLCTVSTGLTFLYQRQCPSHHIPLFHCILCPHRHISLLHCILHPLCPLV